MISLLGVFIITYFSMISLGTVSKKETYAFKFIPSSTKIILPP